MTDQPKRPEQPEAPDAGESPKPLPARPTPVRDLMEGAHAEAEPARSRTIEVARETWHVRVGGRHKSGTRPDTGASLLLLFFHRSEEEGKPDREIYVPVREMDQLSDTDLADLLGRARPHRTAEESRSDQTPGRSRRRSSRGRG
jgi:hypothetical protein